MYCFNCGNEVSDKADVCVKCGVLLKKENTNYDDKPSAGLNVISCLWPFVGFILYITMMNKTPVKAKKCGKWALIGFIISFVIFMFSFIIGFIIGINDTPVNYY